MVYLWLRAGATGLYDIRVRCCRLEAGAEASGSAFMDADGASDVIIEAVWQRLQDDLVCLTRRACAILLCA